MEGGPIIRIKCEEGYLEQPDLSRKDSMNVIYKWLKGSRGVDVSVTFGGDMTRMLMSWPETADSLNINVPTGVRCLTCGKFEPDVASWYERHSYKKFPCKGLNITTTKIPASLLVVEELSQIALINLNTYSLAGNHPLTLRSSSIHGALPTELITGNDTASLTELTRFLVSLEEELVSALPGSENINGHESY